MADKSQAAPPADGVQDDKSVDLDTLFPKDSQQDKVEPTAEADEKDESSSSEDAAEPDATELKAQLEALTKELNRVRKSKTESSHEVHELREQLANVQGQLEILARGASKQAEQADNKLGKYSDEQLVQGQTEWEEELSDAKDALRKARADNDESAYRKAEKEITIARSTLTAIRKELLERSKRVATEQVRAQGEATEIVQEVVGLYDEAYEAFPDLKDRNSDIWKAGNETYNAHPKLMKQLGPLGELVAVALAVTRNPELLPGGGSKKAAAARKELLTEINDKAEKSLIKGGGTATKKSKVDFDSMPKEQFEAMIHRLKMGS